MITSDKELKKAFAKINGLLQQTHDYLGNDDKDKYDGEEFLVRFPTHYIRSSEVLHQYVDFINDSALRENIVNSLMLSDLNGWMMNRTNLHGTLKEMIIKNEIILMAGISESLAEEFGEGEYFKDRIRSLRKEDIISQTLKDNLFWLWKSRQSIHLWTLKQPEHGKYKYSDYNRAVNTSAEFVSSLMKK